MSSVRAQRTTLGELTWLLDASESRQPLTELSPILVRYGIVHSGPPVPHPEYHPYCEFGTNIEGEVESLVEGEKAIKLPGDLFLAGPMVPHWARITRYPLRFITVYFLPSVLIELGPESDGPQILYRFTAQQSLNDRLVRLPPILRRQFKNGFEKIVAVYEQEKFGREIELRTLLMGLLVQLLRWEQKIGRKVKETRLINWKSVSKSLQYLRENFREPIYAADLARIAGVSESRLRLLFKHALGVNWSKYLQAYRIHRAALLLSQSGGNVYDAALEVGFESWSHFHAAFRSIMGVTPSDYVKQSAQKAGPLPGA
ncbi:MAG: AraC family transcriptional regulator [Candidatus Omnitrophica bacterium]|nr:AraC family transcriptional regulator [Candidatus Omnitrophota bacterium]